MTEKRPWIKVLNIHGKCLVRCKDPKLAAVYFVVFRYNNGSVAYYDEVARRLFLDGMEYNPPLRTHNVGRSLRIVKKEWINVALNDLKYLIDLHKSFYY